MFNQINNKVITKNFKKNPKNFNKELICLKKVKRKVFNKQLNYKNQLKQVNSKENII